MENVSGDITRALVAGASTIMLAGTQEDPDKIIYQLEGSLRSGMSYCNAATIPEPQM